MKDLCLQKTVLLQTRGESIWKLDMQGVYVKEAVKLSEARVAQQRHSETLETWTR